jgi:hypothetical protein
MLQLALEQSKEEKSYQKTTICSGTVVKHSLQHTNVEG